MRHGDPLHPPAGGTGRAERSAGAPSPARRARPVLLGLAILLAVGCSRQETREGAEPQPPGGSPIELLVAGDGWGEIAPCGCRGRPAGGLARRATLVAERRRDGAPLLLDAGDTLFATGDAAGEADRQKAKLILAALGSQGVAAMGVGERDLAAGLPFLLEEAAAAGLPLLSANLRGPDGERPFLPSRLVSTPGGQVGLLGVWASRTPPPAETGLRVEDPVAAAGEEAERLRKAGAALVVALVHGNGSEARTIARVPGIDLVFPAHDGAVLLPTREEGGGWVLGAGLQGRSLLAVTVHGASLPGPLADAGQAERIERERTYLRGRLADARQRAAAAPPELRGELEKVVSHFEQREQTLAREAEEARRIGGRRFEARQIDLDTSVADDPAWKRRVEELIATHPEAAPKF